MIGAAAVDTPLGINTKLDSAPHFGSRKIVRLRRWAEQIATGEANMIRFAQLAYLREYLPNDIRTKFCLARLQFGREDVTLLYSPEKKSRFHGATVCGSVWTCPVCAERITAVRRSELKKLLALTKYRVVMVTFTLEHHEGESLKPMVDALNKAVRGVKIHRPWRRFCAKWGVIGHVYALEVTHGDNGWHPHRHEMFILDPAKSELPGEELKRLYESEMQAELYSMYHYELNKAGRDCSEEHGVHVSANRRDYGDYIEKWGVTEELTRSTNKVASGAGKSVWELLTDSVHGDKKAWALFMEYARAFKGKKQLHWSKGLRELLELPVKELTDEEAAQIVPEPDDKPVVIFTRLGWYHMLERDLLGPVKQYSDQVNGNSTLVLAYLARMGLRRFVTGCGPGCSDW